MEQGAGGQEFGQLVWRCRRGMKELDLLLLEYLRGGWSLAPDAEREVFVKILDLPDPVLAAYLLGDAECTDPALAPLLATLRTLAARRHQAGAARMPAGAQP